MRYRSPRQRWQCHNVITVATATLTECRRSNIREVSVTDRLTTRMALTGATASIAERPPVTSNGETRSTDSQADERREVCVTKKGGPGPPFLCSQDRRLSTNNAGRSLLRTGDHRLDLQIKVSRTHVSAVLAQCTLIRCRSKLRQNLSKLLPDKIHHKTCSWREMPS